jgi:hypothetical protein
MVTSAPAGGGMTEPLTMIIPIFTALPAIRPVTTAIPFLSIGFIE